MLRVLPLLLLFGCGSSADRVVVYCAQDAEYAGGVFDEFARQGRRTVAPKFDTEANKSVSLAVELEQEAGRPRCDVHWNNEILGTIRLARKGVYAPYSSPGAADFPPWSKATDGTWQAFAERARVLIVNTDLVPEAERPTSILDLTNPKWRGKLAMAKPQFGTTATHAACLFEVLGHEPAREFFRGLTVNDVALLAGNKTVARGVADGQYALGLTDTDDAVLEVIAGKPVAIVFLDEAGHPLYPRLGTLFIPNTLAVVKGAPNEAGAKALVDFLLTREAVLAAGGGYQYPVAPAQLARPHPALKTRHEVTRMAVDFDRAADQWDAVQAFLRDEFAR
jgi:iron(III) transport system substrate-binding protein